ncbi:hypothetical protein C2845_PM18G10760 [Panicum miliaceum]|uniref:NB-ARC domain-containing protein n=1 Tax=Panicum miliaceum TaxID=4540 RepID=A0A3L6PLK5_PANMI|nr:hypothetical protein C2845_PM18G10760 [Panicum miliaceum]
MCMNYWTGLTFFMTQNHKITKPMGLDVEDCLRRVLLRAQVIIDEAMGRHITNQAMLLQLVMLRDAMHHGYYMLDTFGYQRHDDEEAKDQAPYSMHLQLANCMFGRQMEAQLVFNFLLHTQPHCAEELEVLPIVGPRYVGKSTLVAHVCKDERVCGHFSKILFLHIHGFTDDELATFRKGCAKFQNHMSDSNKDGRLLVVLELDGDLSEEALNRMYSASKRCVPRGSKIILTSWLDNIAKFGTAKALTLKYLSHEAYWYFFKMLTVGSMDPEMHPRLMHLAMELARMQKSSFVGANLISRLLRDNFDPRFWFKVVAFFRGFISQHISRFGDHPFDRLYQNRPAHLRRMVAPSESLVIYHHQQHSSDEEVPKIRMDDVMYGSTKPHGKFEVLVWKSHIPPYHSYIYTCEIQEIKNTGAKRKRCMGGM